MNDLANSKTTQQDLEDNIFAELKKLEAEGNYTKGVSITRDTARRFVKEMAMRS